MSPKVLSPDTNLAHLKLLPAQLSFLAAPSAAELGSLATIFRRIMTRQRFSELTMSPFDAFPNTHSESINISTGEQLRFNTEPEIWSGNNLPRFYSISPIFRNELYTSIFRLRCFHIFDAYYFTTTNGISRFLTNIINHVLIETGLPKIDWINSNHDEHSDAPSIKSNNFSWIITSGYTPRNSFFDLDENGHSTRQELFLSTPYGFLEIGALGLAGRKSPLAYCLRGNGDDLIQYRTGLYGLGIGLERLFVACQLLRSVEVKGTTQ